MILQIPVQTGYNYVTKLQDMALTFAPKLLGAVLVYIIGSFIIRNQSILWVVLWSESTTTVLCKVFYCSLVKVMLNILFVNIAALPV